MTRFFYFKMFLLTTILEDIIEANEDIINRKIIRKDPNYETIQCIYNWLIFQKMINLKTELNKSLLISSYIMINVRNRDSAPDTTVPLSS